MQMKMHTLFLPTRHSKVKVSYTTQGYFLQREVIDVVIEQCRNISTNLALGMCCRMVYPTLIAHLPLSWCCLPLTRIKRTFSITKLTFCAEFLILLSMLSIHKMAESYSFSVKEQIHFFSFLKFYFKFLFLFKYYISSAFPFLCAILPLFIWKSWPLFL